MPRMDAGTLFLSTALVMFAVVRSLTAACAAVRDDIGGVVLCDTVSFIWSTDPNATAGCRYFVPVHYVVMV
ncbi:MAG TPA: hypothetical protein VGG14_00395 [Candidatus Sulfotelmatobacter sp.]